MSPVQSLKTAAYREKGSGSGDKWIEHELLRDFKDPFLFIGLCYIQKLYYSTKLDREGKKLQPIL